jgi:ubiquinone/menaquinone biosynthesis C-methylase UbiE
MAEERLNFEIDSPWKGEHYHRYAELAKHIGSRDVVLDIACGMGYGTHRIATYSSNTVIGGDISAEAVEECKKTWKKDNLDFRVLDGTNLAFPDQYFDKVVSFETIEHTTEYMAMLKEFYRVLKSGGVAIISTPNFLINSPKGYIQNPYHTQEFVLDELRNILQSVFDNVQIYGQKYSRYENPATPGAGKLMEFVLKIKGIRKLPVSVKNKISRMVIKKQFYPGEDDFTLTADEKSIVKCQTFFCLCKKK